MSSDSPDSDLEAKVELLKEKYLERRKRVTDAEDATGSASDFSDDKQKDDAISRKAKVKTSPSYREMKSHSKALKELLEAVSRRPQSESEHGDSDSEDDFSDHTDVFDRTNLPCTETDVTLPSDLGGASSSCGSEGAGSNPYEALRHRMQGLVGSPTAMGQIYQEMLHIYEKLQAERLRQQGWGVELCEREQQLQRRERLLLQQQNTIHRLKGVEGEVLNRIHTLQQQYQQEMEKLREALKEKTKEIKRIKSSFDSIKELNDSMRKQLNEVSEQNRRLESQSKKVHARLDNLQRKYEYCTVRRGRENLAPMTYDPKPPSQDKPLVSNKVCKGPSSAGTLKLMGSLLDWVLDAQLTGSEEERKERETEPFGLPPPCLDDRCAKVLPLLVEQVQQAAVSESTLLLPLLRFTYSCLTQLQHSTQHPPLTSTLRRLGEEVSRGPAEGSRSRSAPLFRSSCLHTRILSTLIILKSISQVDILAQALDVLHGDVGTEEGKALFLKYQAVEAILTLLRTGSPGLLAPTLDILVQMSAESRHLSNFLDACSTNRFFRCSSLLLRNPRLDLALTEKLSVVLQKLSGIRKNKRLFEAASLHLLLQEMHRTADPSQAFLSINFSSILFNLGMPTRP